MNQTEARYADYLERLRLAGLIQWWGFEVTTINLADRTSYTPDFTVLAQDCALEFHEVKACWKPKFGKDGELVRKAGAGWKEDARIKIKMAAEHYPATFKGLHQDPSGEWRVEIF